MNSLNESQDFNHLDPEEEARQVSPRPITIQALALAEAYESLLSAAGQRSYQRAGPVPENLNTDAKDDERGKAKENPRAVVAQ